MSSNSLGGETNRGELVPPVLVLGVAEAGVRAGVTVRSVVDDEVVAVLWV
jgi:hypothetical protein